MAEKKKKKPDKKSKATNNGVSKKAASKPAEPTKTQPTKRADDPPATWYGRLLNKLSSRKFVMTLATQVIGVYATVNPGLDIDEANQAAVRIAGLVVLVAATVFYVVSEGRIDRERERNRPLSARRD